VQPAGRGQLYAQFEELKARLAAAGLFDPERKRSPMRIPRRLGIVTSVDAAALRDILRVLSARWPLVDVVLFPTLVQGADAPAQIVLALQTANRFSAEREPLDAIILARGGGSIEDLWSFNDEAVAHAIAQSHLPVVAGVGHETDFTIADFVADLRAPTPSAAAAAVIPDRAEFLDGLAVLHEQLTRDAVRQIDACRRNLAEMQARLRRLHPARQLDLRRQQLDDRERRLHGAARVLLRGLAERNAAARLRLHALSPQAVLRRGYSIVRRENEQVVRGPDGLASDEPLTVRAADGQYRVRVVLEDS
jgi:exodeoxyribonuclease VII large subunit